MSHTPTPGPWSTGGFFNDGTRETQWIWGPTPDDCQSGEVIAINVTPENARLIAAAPRMYAFIEFCAAAGNAEAQAILEDINVR